MNAFQLQLLKAKGYEFQGTETRTRSIGGKTYVALAIKNGKRAEAGGPSIRDAEHRLVLNITAPGDDRAAEQWRREERFVKRMWKRYGFGRR